jgi:hypothetical protein
MTGEAFVVNSLDSSDRNYQIGLFTIHYDA